MNESLVMRLLSEDVLVPVLISGGVICIVLIKTIGSTIKTTARERTRREIAAYISEGTMTPEQGERLMRSGGGSSRDACC